MLRGPQGTLFGRNTTGGAVSITTRKPAKTFGGFVEGSYGSFNRGMARGFDRHPDQRQAAHQDQRLPPGGRRLRQEHHHRPAPERRGLHRHPRRRSLAADRPADLGRVVRLCRPDQDHARLGSLRSSVQEPHGPAGEQRLRRRREPGLPRDPARQLRQFAGGRPHLQHRLPAERRHAELHHRLPRAGRELRARLLQRPRPLRRLRDRQRNPQPPDHAGSQDRRRPVRRGG